MAKNPVSRMIVGISNCDEPKAPGRPTGCGGAGISSKPHQYERRGGHQGDAAGGDHKKIEPQLAAAASIVTGATAVPRHRAVLRGADFTGATGGIRLTRDREFADSPLREGVLREPFLGLGGRGRGR